ncbi:MAG: hypothetical protein U1D30_11970 [Planctomycetota bacterium]
MSTLIHRVVLQNDAHFGRKLPLHHLGVFLAELPLAIRAAVSMAFRNRSQVKGRRPDWLERSTDVRFVDHQGNGESVLYFEAPALGEAAREMYEQPTLAPEFDDRPAREDTAFDLLGDVLADVQQRNGDSARFDPALLDRITHFGRVFKKGPYREVDFTSRRFPKEAPARINPALIESAKDLLGKTPLLQRVRIVGTLDGFMASTQRFFLVLDSGERIVGVFNDNHHEVMPNLWKQRILISGMVI